MRTPLIFVAAIALASAGAAQAPGFTESERAYGAKANPELIAQYGGAWQGPQAAYVRSVGQRIAVESGMAARPTDYTVTLLNSNANNAFAIPGGYVYVTRQLVALMNSEAELAFVMGHEVGHVAAHHSQKRQQRAQLTGIGAALLGAVTGSNIVGNLAGAGAQLYTLGYSRDQEREADSLGVRYLARAGYDPRAGGAILAALGAQTALEARLAGRAADAPATWLSTHPATAERVARVSKEAAALTPAVRPGAPPASDRDRFLDAIDGMPYDDDPAQGVVTGSSFRHAGLGLAFDAPAGFALQNGTSAVSGTRPGAGQFQFSGGAAAGLDLAGYSARVWQAAGAAAAPPRPARINGIDAVISRQRLESRGGAVDATLAVYRWDNRQFFHVLAVAPAGSGGGFDTLVNSVRRLTPGEATAVRGRRVAVVRVRAGDSVASLAAKMAYADDRVARFTILNGLTADSRLVPGQRVKLIVAG